MEQSNWQAKNDHSLVREYDISSLMTECSNNQVENRLANYAKHEPTMTNYEMKVEKARVNKLVLLQKSKARKASLMECRQTRAMSAAALLMNKEN